LVAGFVAWLVWTPVRTPFVIAAVTAYGPPAAPNAWAREDLDRFRELDQAEVLKCSEIAWDSSLRGCGNCVSNWIRPRPAGRQGCRDPLSQPARALNAAANRACSSRHRGGRQQPVLPVRDLLRELFGRNLRAPTEAGPRPSWC